MAFAIDMLLPFAPRNMGKLKVDNEIVKSISFKRNFIIPWSSMSAKNRRPQFAPSNSSNTVPLTL